MSKVFKLFFIAAFVFILPGYSFSNNNESLVDQLGNRLTIEHPLERIVSLAPNITELIYSLGVEDNLVGVSSDSDYPLRVLNIKKIGNYNLPSLESILLLKPDICLATVDGTPLGIIDKIKLVNIPVAIIDPSSISKLKESIKIMGTIFNKQKQADILVSEINLKINEIQNKIKSKNYANKPVVLVVLQKKPLIVVGNNTFINDLIVMSGGINFAENLEGYPIISLEEVLLNKLDLIVIIDFPADSPADKLNFESIFKNKDGLQIKYANADIFTRPSMRCLDALEQLYGWLYP